MISDANKLLQGAIDNRQVIELQYGGKMRVVQPLSIRNGTTLVGWQTGGETASGRKLPCWFQCTISAAEDLKETGETFLGNPDGFKPDAYK